MKKPFIAAVVVAALFTMGVGPTSAAEIKDGGKDKASFLAGVEKVGFLTPAEALAAWNDPAVRGATLVDYEDISEESAPVPASKALLEKSGIAMTAALAAATKQKTWTVTRVYYTDLGTSCATWKVTKTFLYNQVRVWHDVVSWTGNPACGFYFDGLTYSSDSYGAIGGIPNSKTVSVRNGLFTYLLGSSKTISITMEGRFNGVTTSSSSIL